MQLELAAVQARDVAGVLVGAEHGVDVPEPFEELVDRVLADVVADVDHDRHAHHVLDAHRAGLRGHQTLFAFSSAAWSDWMNAWLVYVAPEIMSMFESYCAFSTSPISIGIAFWLMNTERPVWSG